MTDQLEALCLTEDGDWDGVAARIGGRLVNREIADSGEYDTVLIIPATGDPDEGTAMAGAARAEYERIVAPYRAGGMLGQHEVDGVDAAVTAAMPYIRADERRRLTGVDHRPIVLHMGEPTRFDRILDDLLELDDEPGALDHICAVIARRLDRVRQTPAPDGTTSAGPGRDRYGRLVRTAWVDAVLELLADPKSSWTTDWDDLAGQDGEFQREVDRRIGEQVATDERERLAGLLDEAATRARDEASAVAAAGAPASAAARAVALEDAADLIRSGAPIP